MSRSVLHYTQTCIHVTRPPLRLFALPLAQTNIAHISIAYKTGLTHCYIVSLPIWQDNNQSPMLPQQDGGDTIYVGDDNEGVHPILCAYVYVQHVVYIRESCTAAIKCNCAFVYNEQMRLLQ